MSHSSFIEGLESRTLLSAAPTLFNATVKADRLVVRADLLKFRGDILGTQAKLIGDTQAIKKNLAKGDTSLNASFQTLHTDSKSLGLQLQEDRLAESAAALADESVIKLDILQILKDRKNTTAEAADHAKLATDRAKLQADLIAGLDSRISTRQSFETTISNDTQAIVTAADNDTNASDALKAAVTKFSADRTARLATLTADLQAISSARATLAADLTASQNT